MNACSVKSETADKIAIVCYESTCVLLQVPEEILELPLQLMSCRLRDVHAIKTEF